MADPFFAGAYWGSRQEPVDSCATRLAECLTRLGHVDPALATWFRKGRSRGEASRQQVTATTPDLTEVLLASRSRRDSDGGTIDELGFTVGLWNRSKPAVAFSTTCGARASDKGVMNSFVLDLPESDCDSTRLFIEDVARSVMRILVECWEPDWATWASYSIRAAQRPLPLQPVIGWFTYLRNVPHPEKVSDTFDKVSLPGTAKIEQMAHGVAVQLGSRPDDISEELVALTRQMLADPAC
jgi:hypothetical protein